MKKNEGLIEKKKFWVNSAIRKVKLPNKRLSLLFKFKKKKKENKNCLTDFEKLNFLKKKKTKGINKKKKANKSHEKIKKGSVIILLGLKFQGKKAILLKITKKGFFVISGPFSINGIPLRRINPRYALPTEINVDLSNMKLGFINDNYFNFLKKSSKFSSEYQKQKLISVHRVRQSAIDEYLKKEIKKHFFLKFYLKSSSKCC
mmetsp:Transcript_29247/g.57225  ORF Transcript_29247/g.57225 Transcript_29247/m.57225 type:complete len:203 (+) Transcript_29247:25-633(+)